MRAEVIALGTELTNGWKLDTNSQWLSTQLSACGVEVLRHTTIGDSLADMVDALQSAARRADVVIITGGLGPTLDDLTREALARMAGVELQLDADLLEHVRSLFRSRGRTMPVSNEIQAMLPVGAESLPNPNGTAPGIWFRWQAAGCRHACQFVALPGVPSEMKPMFRDTVVPRLAGHGQVIQRRRINCFGAGESAIEDLLGGLTKRGRNPEVGITASDATITLRLVATGNSAVDCQDMLDATQQQILDKLGNLVFGLEDQTLADVVVQQAAARGLTVGTIEQGTGGLISNWLHKVDSTGDHVRGGLVATSADTIGRLLNLSGPADLAEVARAGLRFFGSDYSLAVGPLTDGQVTVSLAGVNRLTTETFSLATNPAIRQSQAAKLALNLLRLRLCQPGRTS